MKAEEQSISPARAKLPQVVSAALTAKAVAAHATGRTIQVLRFIAGEQFPRF